ncbi:hypothetical protein [Chryseobacterium balustinum]|uniref:hypothetical protein n=1 Tax=Chryseobacterium balustinum TaxID=246 RepID=UPI003CF942F9
MENFKIDLEAWKYAFEKAKEDRDKYFEWIKNEIEIATDLINKYNKLYILGGLGTKLLQASPNLFNQSMEIFEAMGNDVEESDKIKLDEEIEVLLEYAMNISLASENKNDRIPTLDNINEIIAQLSKIKLNVGFYEMTSELPKDGNEFDHLLKFTTMEDNLHVRGNGYEQHIIEVYKELFEPFDDFLQKLYGFDS